VRPIPALCAALCAALGLVPAASHAATCFVVFDRNENIIYRDVFPPVDLSDAGKTEREAMRQRGEFLMFLEADQCPRLEFFTGSAGTSGLRLEDTLSPTPIDTSPATAPVAPPPPKPARPAR
jgi:hypothetical protein